MTCRATHFEDLAPTEGYTWTADSLADAVMVPTHKPLNHDVSDGAPAGGMSWRTAHRARVQAVAPDKPQAHVAYGRLVRRAQGDCVVELPSQPGLSDNTRAWQVGQLTRQAGPDPDGLIPEGACYFAVRHLTTFPVEHRFDANTIICGGDAT